MVLRVETAHVARPLHDRVRHHLHCPQHPLHLVLGEVARAECRVRLRHRQHLQLLGIVHTQFQVLPCQLLHLFLRVAARHHQCGTHHQKQSDERIPRLRITAYTLPSTLNVELPEVRDKNHPVLTENVRHSAEEGIHRLLHFLDGKTRLKSRLSQQFLLVHSTHG